MIPISAGSDLWNFLRKEEIMETYNFETVIGEDGIILLPDYIKKLKTHRVKLILLDLGKSSRNVTTEIGDPGRQADEEDRLLGLFSDEPELIDEITESAMKSREKDPLR